MLKYTFIAGEDTLGIIACVGPYLTGIYIICSHLII
jgi:hypothetical protein